MKILFQDQQVELAKDVTIDEVIKNINELLHDRYYFSHLVANGVEVFENPEIYLTEYTSKIDTLEIIAIPAKEFINNLLLSTEEYTERAIPFLKDLAEEFYHNPTKDSWSELANLFEGAQWLLQMVHTIEESLVRPKNWDVVMKNIQNMQDEMEDLEEALKNNDTVLIADMLNYEFLPVFEEIAVEVKNAIDSEGVRHDLS